MERGMHGAEQLCCVGAGARPLAKATDGASDAFVP